MSESKLESVKVAIVGAGPAGIGAAVALARMGVGPIALIERENKIGGIAAHYTSDDVPTYVMWTRGKVVPGHRFAARLRKELEQTDAAVHLESTVVGIDPKENVLTIVSPDKGLWRLRADAILLACGARESSRSERGWIYGHRPAGVYHTTNILDLGAADASQDNAAVIGSELMGYAAAAKLGKRGAKRVALVDKAARPRAWLPKRLYFYRWTVPNWQGGAKSAIIRGNRAVERVEFDGKSVAANQVAITGALVPNSELAAEAGLPVQPIDRRVLGISCYRIDDTKIFVAGNMLGINCSGQWAYWTGKWAARRIKKVL